MLVLAYLIPLLACLVLGLASGWQADWPAYLWTVLLGEGTAGGLHWFFYHKRAYVPEYLGSIVTKIVHEDAWTELSRRKVQKTDSNGRTCTVEVIDEIHHPEEYSFHTSLGHHFKTNSDFFFHVFARWEEPHKVRRVTGSHIKSGRRNIESKSLYDEDLTRPEHSGKYIPISERHYYKNKIRNSNSVFNFANMAREEARMLGLHEWPDTDSRYDAPAILAGDFFIPDDIDQGFRRFNAVVASKHEMRLFVLMFPAGKGIGVAQEQERYWKGGNKNEFTVCLGIGAGQMVEWCYCFSWADDKTVEVETAEWFRHHPRLDLRAFLKWFEIEHLKWRRKEFSDFEYVNIGLELWQYLSLIGVGALMSGVMVWVGMS